MVAWLNPQRKQPCSQWLFITFPLVHSRLQQWRRCLVLWIDVEMFDTGLSSTYQPLDGVNWSVRSHDPQTIMLQKKIHNWPMIFIPNSMVDLSNAFIVWISGGGNVEKPLGSSMCLVVTVDFFIFIFLTFLSFSHDKL